MDKTDLKYLKKYIKNKNIYMFWGFDKNDQYSSLKELNAIIKNIAKELANNSIIFYFGEFPDIEKPDIGYVISQIKNIKNDIEIIMFDSEFQYNEIPDFVSNSYKIEVKTEKKRGINIKNNKPLGLTKLWIDLNKIQNIEKIFILGGNHITLEENNIAREFEINTKYYPLKRKFLGDSNTPIKKNAVLEEKIGVTHILNVNN